ncbi:hypothetical protein BCR42DRAFT_420892 [Absidia repens]|uniref:Uncharacterized protein n=1 Tax=Absidia repens TaxID=90262 RepID=A0A1X2I925_9FUNG|nr:hypothetical protein BCR42DRAFT_420892 [Absidia repens]
MRNNKKNSTRRFNTMRGNFPLCIGHTLDQRDSYLVTGGGSLLTASVFALSINSLIPPNTRLRLNLFFLVCSFERACCSVGELPSTI